MRQVSSISVSFEISTKPSTLTQSKHQVYTMDIYKCSLNSFDSKQYLCKDKIHTLACGHYRIPQLEQEESADEAIDPHAALACKYLRVESRACSAEYATFQIIQIGLWKMVQKMQNKISAKFYMNCKGYLFQNVELAMQSMPVFNFSNWTNITQLGSFISVAYVTTITVGN